MQTASESFAELLRALETGAADAEGVNVRLSGDTARWLHDGMIAYRENERRTLCVALALRRRGLDSRPLRYARETRDTHLRLAYAHIDGKSEYDRCKSLSKAIKQFESRTWRRVRYEAEPPHRLSPAQRELFHAFKVCDRVPTSPSRLSEILRGNTAF